MLFSAVSEAIWFPLVHQLMLSLNAFFFISSVLISFNNIFVIINSATFSDCKICQYTFICENNCSLLLINQTEVVIQKPLITLCFLHLNQRNIFNIFLIVVSPSLNICKLSCYCATSAGLKQNWEFQCSSRNALISFRHYHQAMLLC